jgi:acyl-coenzyme A thioesterase PaaI-like protein
MTQVGEGAAEEERVVASRGDSFGVHLDIATLLVSPERCLARAPVTDAVRSSAGAAALSLLVMMVDVAGSYPALVTGRPDWTATQDLSVQAGWITEGPVVLDMRLVRVGGRTITVAGTLHDGHGVDDLHRVAAGLDDVAAASPDRPTGGAPAASLAPAGAALVTFRRLPGSAAHDVDFFTPHEWIGEVRQNLPERPARPGTLRERVGLRAVDAAAGVVEVDNSPYVANSIGTISGPVQGLAIEAAAEALRPGLVATDVQLHFLSQVRAGPARTRATVVRDAADHSVVTVELLDVGADERVAARAAVTLQRPPA